ncbi:MAG: glycosyltransferase family 2 protein [Sphingomonadales bacterium]
MTSSTSSGAGSPTVSVVTACYNSMRFIDRLFSSLERQTDKNFEWITVDDGSSDETVPHLTRLAAPGALGMAVYKLPQNSGGGVAVGHGVDQAVGNVILIIDHDDELMPDAIAQVRGQWAAVEADPTVAGLFFRIVDDKSGDPIGGPLAPGTRFTQSWLSNRRPDIVDGSYAFKAADAKRFFSAQALESICLFGVPLTEMSQEKVFVVGSGPPIRTYHRDNPASQTNAVTLTRKTVFTYARYLDVADRHAFAQISHWLRHLVTLSRMSVQIHGSPLFPMRLVRRWPIKLLIAIAAPAGMLLARGRRNDRIKVMPPFPLDQLEGLPDLHSSEPSEAPG